MVKPLWCREFVTSMDRRSLATATMWEGPARSVQAAAALAFWPRCRLVGDGPSVGPRLLVALD